ncbi:hypothetical protein ACQPZK_04290 [Micromonospora sp. CA-249363]|jgi:hypothetical protein|uniref:hypothetical protein n=1 Tax=Micromonospora sp. CA-249363 TaxID=3239963 RepID=UPI003D93FD0A
MRTLRLVVPALVVCAALSACGATDGPATPGGPAATTGQPASASPSTPESPITPAPPIKSPGGPTVPPPVGATELTGTITAGVEPNCVLLDGYLLVGGPRDVLTAGARVTVTGRVEKGTMTTCQQGIPFVVESANRG